MKNNPKKTISPEYKDNLTNIYNYSYIMERVKEEFSATERLMHPLSCIMMDVDGLKEINEKWGMEAGNQVLINIAELIFQNIRLYDLPGRYEESEFIILARNTPFEDAKIVSERLRRVVEKYDFLFRENKIKVSTSVGVSTLFDENFINYKEFLKQAERALIKAKNEGGNRVVWDV